MVHGLGDAEAFNRPAYRDSRWSLDHLVVDQDAVPTFVEVKRASDTRARREVMAQMLDYAAKGSAFWTPDQCPGAWPVELELDVGHLPISRHAAAPRRTDAGAACTYCSGVGPAAQRYSPGW